MAAPRRPDERRGGDRDHEDYRRNEPARTEAPAARTRAQLNEYFVEGEGIHREVLQMEICRYLGAEATCRPGEYNGRHGYRVKALRPFTPEMIHDLKTASRDYISENRDRRTQRYQEVPYEESDTRRLNNNTSISSAELSYQNPSAASATAPGYPGSETAPGISYPSSSAYPTGSGYVSASSFATAPSTNAPSGFQPMTSDPTRNYGGHNYTYGPPREYPQPGYPGYPLAANYRDQAQDQQPLRYMYPNPTGPPMPLGRGVAMDSSRGYYESNMEMAPPSSSTYGPPYRNRSPPYGEPGPSRAHDSRQGAPPDSYQGYRRR